MDGPKAQPPTDPPLDLDRVFRPRSLRLLGDRRMVRQAVVVAEGLARPARGPVDLALVVAEGLGTDLWPLLERAASEAALVALLWPRSLPASTVRGRTSAPSDVAEMLGACGGRLLPLQGLWSPTLVAGMPELDVHRPRGAPSFLVLADDPGLLQQVLLAASARRLPLRGALSLAFPDGCEPVLPSVSQLSPPARLILALHRPLSASAMGRLERLSPWPVVLLCGQATTGRVALDGPAELGPRGEDLARALGLVLTRSPAELLDAACWQIRDGLWPGAVNRLAVHLDSPGQAALLDDRARALGLCSQGPSTGSRARAGRTRRTTSPVGTAGSTEERGSDLRRELTIPGLDIPKSATTGITIQFKETPFIVSTGEGIPPLPPSSCPQSEPWAVLAALAHLGHAAAARQPAGPRPSRTQAHSLPGLTRLPASLDEVHLRQLLAGSPFDFAPGGLVSSASGAAKEAARIGFPVALKPVGPALHQRQRRGAVALALPNEALVRQAFRDVLDAVSDEDPPLLLQGVLVCAMVPHDAALDCALLMPETSPPLLRLQVRHVGGHGQAPRWMRCPFPEGLARAAVHALADQGLFGHPGPASDELTSLTRFLLGLGWAGSDLSGRLRWLHLDTVAPPRGGHGPIILDARGCAALPSGS